MADSVNVRIEDDEGNIYYVQTTAENVILKNGSTLEQKLKEMPREIINSVAIITSSSGEEIEITDSAEAPLMGLKLYATCEQENTTGANLFDGSEYGKKTASGITVEWLQEEGCFLLNGTATETVDMRTPIDIVAEKGATYTLQNCYVSGKISVPEGGFATSFFGASDTEDSSNNWLSCHLKEEGREASKQCNYSYITGFWFYITTGVVLNDYKVRIQLAKSSASLPYEPYTGGIPSPNGDYPQEIQTISDFTLEVNDGANAKQELSIAIPEQGFYGIPVESGGNYVDKSGQQWISDEFDFKNKKFIKRVGKEVFDGSEDENWICDPMIIPDFAVITLNSASSSNMDNTALCNRAICPNSAYVLETDFWFRVDQNTYTDIDKWKEWLSTHSIEILYPLATPVEYDLTDEEVQAFMALHTYKPATHISNDNDAEIPVGMEASYVADLQAYINSKAAALSNSREGE